MAIQAQWYINRIPIYDNSPDDIEPEWEDEVIAEVVHLKGSDLNEEHIDGLSHMTKVLEVRVHRDRHAELKGLRKSQVTFKEVETGNTYTATLMKYTAPRRRGSPWHIGTIELTRML